MEGCRRERLRPRVFYKTQTLKLKHTYLPLVKEGRSLRYSLRFIALQITRECGPGTKKADSVCGASLFYCNYLSRTMSMK